MGKVALVTGGTKGIGLAIARALAEKGAHLFICARTGPDIEETIRLLRDEFGIQTAGQECDVRNYEQVKSIFNKVHIELGGLDILINNAGVGLRSNVEETSVEDWKRVIETNLNGVFFCSREAIPLMRARGGGYIINIGSLAGKQAFPGASAYNASKFGLIGLSEAMMQEVRYDHIRVSYIMPGSVDTDFGMGVSPPGDSGWKLKGSDVADVVIGLLEMDPGALASRVEIRPSEPKK